MSSATTEPTTTTSSSANANLQELNETVDRLSGMKGVEAVLILNDKGDILASSSQTTETERAAACRQLLQAAQRAVQDDGISWVQIRSSNSGRELVLAPHDGFCLAVVKKTAAAEAV